MKNAVFWDVTPCGACREATRSHITEDGILHSHYREYLTYYKVRVSFISSVFKDATSVVLRCNYTE
jgi:cytidine deaminase